MRTLIIILTLALASAAWAQSNVDLSTVPLRNTVQLTIYNSEDLTLVRETRVLSFKKGLNPLQFSWANTLIDPSSVELRFLDHRDQLDLLDTTYPHDKPQMLYWNVESKLDGEAKVEITYFTSGITWSADYLAIAGGDERTMSVDSYVRVTNNSGEDYENAQVRLVVGTINLVEKIAQLARVGLREVEGLSKEERGAFRRDAARKSMALPAAPAASGAASDMAFAQEAKQIIKEGLSEYFIYTIDGTETIPHGWSKRLRSFVAQDVPLRVQYRYRPMQYGDQLVRLFITSNDEASKLGQTPLPDGTVRVFRSNGRGGLSFLAQQAINYVPIGDKIELNLGPDPEVIFELIKLNVRRDNIWMHVHGANVFRRVGDGQLQIEANSSVAGWDDRELFSQRIRNYTGKPIDVEVRRAFPGHVQFRSELKPVLHDYQTPQFSATVPAGQKADLKFEIIRMQGRNATQNDVTLVAGKAGS
jgi:hypothetical protein